VYQHQWCIYSHSVVNLYLNVYAEWMYILLILRHKQGSNVKKKSPWLWHNSVLGTHLTNYTKIDSGPQSMDSDRSPLCMHKKRGRTFAACKHYERACQISASTSPHRLLFTLTVQPSITYGRMPLPSMRTNYLKFISNRYYKLEMSNLSIIQCRGHRSLHHIPANNFTCVT
jgi:hypothetical protein